MASGFFCFVSAVSAYAQNLSDKNSNSYFRQSRFLGWSPDTEGAIFKHAE
jgi:hypothetical protein